MEGSANAASHAATVGSTRPTAKSFISRSFNLSKRGNGDELDLRGPLGLTTLHVPDPGQTLAATADTVFVHGLNGGSSSTWSKGNDPACFWPRQWLPREDGFQDVRIHTFGYPAAATRESILNVRDFARSLLAALLDSPLMSKGDQVCFEPTSCPSLQCR